MTLEVPTPWEYDDRNKRWTRQFDNGDIAIIAPKDQGNFLRCFAWRYRSDEWGELEATEPTFAAARTSVEATHVLVTQTNQEAS